MLPELNSNAHLTTLDVALWSTDRCSQTVKHICSTSESNWRQRFCISFIWQENLHSSYSALLSWQESVKCLNMHCCIKEVTNQAVGETCHRVSILQGCCSSLRKTTPSVLTSNNPLHIHSLPNPHHADDPKECTPWALCTLIHLGSFSPLIVC